LTNFEEREYGRERPFVEPLSVQEGLAVYAVGSGEPALLFPYPHAQTTTPMAQEPLAARLVEMGRTVVTFDVPGAYRSTRKPVGDMDELIRCADETLDRAGIDGPFDVVGHSMGGLSALAYAVERPERTRRLVLVGAMSGFPAVARWGLPGSSMRAWQPDYWRLIAWGIRIKLGFGNLALHKKLQNLMERACYYDKTRFTPLEIDADGREQGIPIRELLWGMNMVRRLSDAGAGRGARSGSAAALFQRTGGRDRGRAAGHVRAERAFSAYRASRALYRDGGGLSQHPLGVTERVHSRCRLPGRPANFLALYVDQDHIRAIAQSVRFDRTAGAGGSSAKAIRGGDTRALLRRGARAVRRPGGPGLLCVPAHHRPSRRVDYVLFVLVEQDPALYRAANAAANLCSSISCARSADEAAPQIHSRKNASRSPPALSFITASKSSSVAPSVR
jgi:pimeloyl-ACP methyl ester carboxylesterase